MDLITCRNLLIYMEPVLQQMIMPTLHYSLKPNGFLWLGGAETTGTHPDLFDAEEVKHRFYRRRLGPSVTGSTFSRQATGGSRSSSQAAIRSKRPGADLGREADRVLASKFAPPGLLVSAGLEILQYRGDVAAYLAPTPGKATLSLLKMLRKELFIAVHAAVKRAGEEKAVIRHKGPGDGSSHWMGSGTGPLPLHRSRLRRAHGQAGGP